MSHQGLTDEQIGKRLGITPRTIRNWRKGELWAEETIKLKEADANAFAKAITEAPQNQSPSLTAEYQLNLIEARDGLKRQAKAQLSLSHALTQTAGEAIVTLRNQGVDAVELTARHHGLLKYAEKGAIVAKAALDLYTKIYAIEEVLEMMANGQAKG